MTAADDDGDDDLLTRLTGHARRISSANALLRRGLQVLAVVAPLLAAGIQVFTDDWADGLAKSTAMVVQIAFLFVAVFCSGWLLVADDTTPELIHDAQEAHQRLADAGQHLDNIEEQVQYLEEDLEWSALLYLTVAAMRRAVDIALVETSDAAAREKRLYVLLDLLVANKHALFDIGDEQWNFAIYLYDTDKDELVCAACRRPTKDEQEAPHRSWKPGEGHTGKAFQDRRPLICADSAEPNVRGFFAASPGQAKEDDHNRYRSIASIPIMLSPEHGAVGVVVATSDVKDRFEPREEDNDAEYDKIEPLRALARTLATLMAAYSVKSESERPKQ